MNETFKKDRRIKTRLLCAELVQVIWRDHSVTLKRRIANLDDISPKGACIQLEVFVPNNTSMTLQYGNGQLTGTVRYCSFREGHYVVGIEFDNGSEWSRKHFHPKHLFDPRRIVPQSVRRTAKYIM